ncbi:MAG: dipeptide epimerase [Pseudomonadota bacterium]
MSRLNVDVQVEDRPLVRPFIISTGARTHQPTLTVTLHDGGFAGRGQATGVAYLGETADTMRARIEAVRSHLSGGLTRDRLAELMPAGGARAALDAALWELEAARANTTVAALIDTVPAAVESAFTIVLDTPDAMAAQTRSEAWRPLLKVKLGGSPELEEARMRAVTEAAGTARRVIDANAGWSPAQLETLAPIAADLGFELLEQPLAMGAEERDDARRALRSAGKAVPLCADESFQTLDDLDTVADLYQFVNIKLDKCGGLTSGLRIRSAARERGLGVFVGCMLAPTLAIAPAHLLAGGADYADLDGPFWFDGEPARLSEDGRFEAVEASVWGAGVTPEGPS